MSNNPIPWYIYVLPLLLLIIVMGIVCKPYFPSGEKENISTEIDEEWETSEEESVSGEIKENFIQEEPAQTTILVTPEEVSTVDESDERVMDAYKYKELDQTLRKIEERTKPSEPENSN